MRTRVPLLVLATALAVVGAGAAEFTHKDWQLVCDNTRTCRAAGYQPDDDDNAIAVLVTRKAGPREQPGVQVMLGSHGSKAATLPGPPILRINGRSASSVDFGDIGELDARQTAALLAALLRASSIEFVVGKSVWRLSDAGAAAMPESMELPAITRLSATQVLASIRCWQGAYNIGYGFWVVDDKPPYRPQLVTPNGSDFENGAIQAAHKGRGLGDCWSNDSWVWDGSRFVHAESSSTGLCKLVAPGGAWVMPSILSKVLPAKKQQ